MATQDSPTHARGTRTLLRPGQGQRARLPAADGRSRDRWALESAMTQVRVTKPREVVRSGEPLDLRTPRGRRLPY
jgi:hypothetical protein